jgi:type IV secretion system protein VirB11
LSDFDIKPHQAALIQTAVDQQQTILIAGKTTAGKTSLANAILALVPKSLRLLLVEDELELEIDTRGRNVTRRRASEDMDFTAHVRAALRDRPDYLILGEIRGSEATDVLEAASSGHPGISTIHAGSGQEALKRLQRLAKCDRELVREAIDLVIQVERMQDGRRAVTQILSLKEDSK